MFGLDALRELAERPPDIAILDLKLPDVDGLTVLKLMKRSETLRNVPVVILTRETHWHMLAVALDAGADGYIFKPVDAPVLGAMLADALARRPNGG